MSSSSAGKESGAAKRARIGSKLLASASCTKTALAKILVTLHEEGLLSSDVIGNTNEGSVRASVTKRAASLASEATPYGPCVQHMNLGGKPWPYIHPMALVFLLSKLSAAFAHVMSECIQGGRELKIVLFDDEYRPGNVLRPDKGRSSHNILWIFSDFPEWLTCKSDAWFQFGTLRSNWADKLPGGISAVMKDVLKVFWKPGGTPNFATTGCILNSGDQAVLFKAHFAGFLGDEKGIKEIFNSKGPAGIRPCLTCKNIVQFLQDSITSATYLQGIDAQRSKFDRATDAEVFQAVDMLRGIAVEGPRSRLERAERACGINHEPNSLLYDDSLRSIVRPISGWIRDWMHMLCVSGVANCELEQLLGVLNRRGIHLTMITNYFSNFNLPKQHGTVSAEWFTTKRTGRAGEDRDGWRGFASELLVIIPIFASFLRVAVMPSADPDLVQHIRCFLLLDKLVKLLGLGSEKAMAWIHLIEETIDKHTSLYAVLYKDVVKPKFHHLHHVVDGMRATSRLLSCWATERYHRNSKAFANRTFRNFEAALTADALNRMVVLAEEGKHFVPEYLKSPVEAERLGVKLFLARSAVLCCGTVATGDVIMLADMRVGFVQCFAFSPGLKSVCVIDLHKPASDGKYELRACETSVVQVDSILAPCIWCKGTTELVVLPPVVSATWT